MVLLVIVSVARSCSSAPKQAPRHLHGVAMAECDSKFSLN